MADDKDAKQSETEQHVKQIIDDSTMVVSPCATPKKCATALTVRGLGPIGGIGRIP